MRIQLSGLTFDRQTFEHSCSAGEYLDDKETFPDNILIRATVAREGNSLRLDLEAELSGYFTCDRCGSSFTRLQEFGGEFFFTFDEGESIATDREHAVIPKGAVSLDISQEIRDLIILSVPSKILCRDDCRGLCSQCGTNLNEKKCKCTRETVDPRWEALQDLRKYESKKA